MGIKALKVHTLKAYALKAKALKTKAISTIELTIAVLMIGLSTAFLAQFTYSYYSQSKIRQTLENQHFVMLALGRYVAQHGYLPYPAVTDSSMPDSSISSGFQRTAEDRWFNAKECIGQVPWRTLNIPYEMSLDGYGKPLIYIMHPLLGRRLDYKHIPSYTDFFEDNEEFDQNNPIVTTNATTATSLTARDVMHQKVASYCYVQSGDNADNVNDNGSNNIKRDILKQHMNRIVLQLNGKDIQMNDQNCWPIGHIIRSANTNPNIGIANIVNSKIGIRFNQKQDAWCDCVAVVLLSAKSIKSSNSSVQIASDRSGDVVKIRLDRSGDIITYSTRNELQIYGGPRCDAAIFNVSEFAFYPYYDRSHYDKTAKPEIMFPIESKPHAFEGLFLIKY